jgi:hypothetical protein
MTSRELVYQTLDFQNTDRVPRQLGTLPWARMFEGEKLKHIQDEFPDDIIWDMPVPYTKKPKTTGDPYEAGKYTDEWGCEFTSLSPGYVGEVKSFLVREENWEDMDNVRFPEELLSFDVQKVNEYCQNTDKFVVQTDFVRPFERMQFIRGTVNLYMDIAAENEGMLRFAQKLHEFNCRQMEAWGKTDVDALFMMDDWGSQNSLLINPDAWVKIFKPMYTDYCNIARKYGKKMFMHSDGNTLKIIPHLIEIGVSAANLQLFCIGLDNLRQFKGKFTFWGEIDRQWILPHGTTEQVGDAVRDVYGALWDNGGCVAQCEFGPGARPENVYKVFETWREMRL